MGIWRLKGTWKKCRNWCVCPYADRRRMETHFEIRWNKNAGVRNLEEDISEYWSRNRNQEDSRM
jgi:hypothetical protein